MRAIILAAGEGSRLRPLTASKPKPMVRVANKPVLQFVLESLVANGVRDVTVVVGYHRERVQSFLGDGKRFGVNVSYAFQDALLGTAHALAGVPVESDEFLVLGGDNIVDATLVNEVLDAPPGLALAAKAAGTPTKYGVLALDGTRVADIEEKPPTAVSEFVNTGVYRFTRAFHEHLRARVDAGVMGVTHVLQDAIRSGENVHAVRARGAWMDAVYPWDLLALNAHLVTDAPPAGTAGVHERAVVGGPALVGRDTIVDANAVVHPTTTLGNNVHVGAGSVIENSILYDDVQVAPGAVIQNSVIGEGARIGPRFTAISGPSDVKVRDGWHALPDFGAVVGEDCVIDGSVTTLPGTIIGNKSRVAAGARVSGVIGDGSTVLPGA